MFSQNGIQLSRSEILAFFDLCKTNSKGYLTFDEFKDLYKNSSADDLFRFFIKRARKMNSQIRKSGSQNLIYLPFNLSRLLEHMALKQRRETVHNRIQIDQFKFGKTVETIKNFVKLFIIDQGAIDTISNDEWSRKVHAAIIRAQNKENASRRKSNPGQFKLDLKNVQNHSLKRLDSIHLNQLTARMLESPSRFKRSHC